MILWSHRLPSLSLLTINVWMVADALVPIQCEYYALEGLSQVLGRLVCPEKMNLSLELEGVVFTMYDARTNLFPAGRRECKQNLNERIYKTIIPRNVRLAEAPSRHGMPINLYDSRSTGAELPSAGSRGDQPGRRAVGRKITVK